MNLSINKPTVVIESNGKIVFKQKCKLSKCRIIAHSFITNNLCVDEIINASPTNPLKGQGLSIDINTLKNNTL